MMNVKKIIKWVCGIAAVLFAVGLLRIGSFVYVTKYRITAIDASLSDDGQHQLLYQSVGEPDVLYTLSFDGTVRPETDAAEDVLDEPAADLSALVAENNAGSSGRCGK